MKRNFVWMLATMLAMAACSESPDDGPGNGNPNEYVGGKGFVNIGINLPTAPSTRAVSYDDGTEEEYKVNDVIIALFYGSDAANATCRHAFKISGDDFKLSGNSTDNVTTYSVTGVRMISAPGEGEKVYALALVNAPSSIFSVTTATSGDNENSGDAILSTKLNFKETEYTQALSNLNEAIANSNIGNGTDGFFMTNASIAIGGETPSSSTAQTLAPITVYKDRSQAEGAAKFNPIYVERAAAKVTVKVNNGTTNDNTLTIDKEKYPHYAGATVKFNGWYLQNTNNTFFPVRKVDGFDTWKTDSYKIGNTNRFVGQTNPYRIFWAVDPNYESTSGQKGNGLTSVTTVADDSWIAMANYGYCAENTTTAATMTGKALTSVLLKAQFTPKGGQANDNFFMLNDINAIYTEADFLTWAKNTLATAGQAATGELSIGTEFTTGKTITTAEDVKKLVKSTEGSELSNEQANTLLEESGNKIKFYKGGVTYYYAAVIKHFGEETPYEGNATTVQYEESKHLGRFGVVRNAWYELNINSVSGPGEPEIPETPVTPPDGKENYINCEINILSWAKRTQDVEL